MIGSLVGSAPRPTGSRRGRLAVKLSAIERMSAREIGENLWAVPTNTAKQLVRRAD